MDKLTALDIEVALSLHWIDYRQKLMVPNVHWGLFSHELDICVMSPAGYVTEIEIKVSKADIKKDLEKRHKHRDWKNRIKFLYFAIPEYLYKPDVVDLIPENAGILVVSRHKTWMYTVSEKRKAEARKGARKLNEKERFQLARLGAMRIWNLKLNQIEMRNHF